MTLPLAAAFLAAWLIAWFATGCARRYALRSGMLDVPEERSSHTQPTPRGGGIAIALVLLPAAAGLGALGVVPAPLALALAGGGLLVAAVGWLDDRRRLSIHVRLLAHLAAAGWAVGWLGGLPTLSYGAGELPLGPAGAALAVVGIVWLINLYNFMDGIDGLAGTQAVLTASAAGAFLLAAGQPGAALLAWLLAGGAAGFLVWNWAPARIFLGDTGSGLLGYAFAVFGLFAERAGAVPLLAAALVLGVFIVDATATLLSRLARGERWHRAHRNHAYQLAVRAGWSHARVTLAIAALTLLLIGVAWLAWRQPELLPPLTAGAFLALALLWAACQRLKPTAPRP